MNQTRDELAPTQTLLGLYASLVADRFMSFSDAVGRLMRKEVAAGAPDLDAAQDRVMTGLVAEISREEKVMSLVTWIDQKVEGLLNSSSNAIDASLNTARGSEVDDRGFREAFNNRSNHNDYIEVMADRRDDATMQELPRLRGTTAQEGTMDKTQTTRLTAQEFATRTAMGTQQSLAASQAEAAKQTTTEAQKDRPKLSMG